MKFIRILFAVLWMLDTMFTSLFVWILGPEVEANPVMYKLFMNHGISAFIAIKMLILAIWFLFPENIRWVRIVSVLLTIIMIYIIGVSVHLFWLLYTNSHLLT